MKPVIHIGPSKTASTTLQATVIPNLGRPYQIKPNWTKAIARAVNLEIDERVQLKDEAIVSHENLGDFVWVPAQVTAQRILDAVGPATIVFVRRRSVDRFISFYRQMLLHQGWTGHGKPYSANEAFDVAMRESNQKRMGVLTSFDLKFVKSAFSNFDFNVVDFDLLKEGFSVFANSFCEACGVHNSTTFPSHENESSEKLFEESSVIMTTKFVSMYREYYMNPNLSESRKEMLATFDEDM